MPRSRAGRCPSPEITHGSGPPLPMFARTPRLLESHPRSAAEPLQRPAVSTCRVGEVDRHDAALTGIRLGGLPIELPVAVAEVLQALAVRVGLDGIYAG